MESSKDRELVFTKANQKLIYNRKLLRTSCYASLKELGILGTDIVFLRFNSYCYDALGFATALSNTLYDMEVKNAVTHNNGLVIQGEYSFTIRSSLIFFVF
jgi:hypothetical protein